MCPIQCPQQDTSVKVLSIIFLIIYFIISFFRYMDINIEALTALCRICGNRCMPWAKKKTLKPIPKAQHHDSLTKIYGIDPNNQIHPSNLCKSCVVSFKRNTENL